MADKSSNPKHIYIAAVLAWLVPGAGHCYQGQRSRGIILGSAIFITFLLGIILGSMDVIDPHNAKAWFVAQLFCGLPTLLDLLLQDPGGQIRTINEIYGRGVDLGQVYAGVAGLLNFLCILDILMKDSQTQDGLGSG